MQAYRNQHSENVESTRAALALDTTIFVKNAPSYAGLGIGEDIQPLQLQLLQKTLLPKNFTRSEDALYQFIESFEKPGG